VKLIDRLTELTRALLTTDTQLQHLRERLDESRQEVRGLAADMRDMRDRLTRLEADRNADRAEIEAKQSKIEANIARFEANLERALLQAERRQLPPPSEA
jgi:chromosome segregation ATPase